MEVTCVTWGEEGVGSGRSDVSSRSPYGKARESNKGNVFSRLFLSIHFKERVTCLPTPLAEKQENAARGTACLCFFFPYNLKKETTFLEQRPLRHFTLGGGGGRGVRRCDACHFLQN
jgi:hypothetical protein